MKTVLKIENMVIQSSRWNENADIPAIGKIHILQNGLRSELEEDDGLFLGYGAVASSYPYPNKNVYNRNLKEETVETYVLENEFLKAQFIPSLGGRLWSLYDKVEKKELLYVNDVIRPSNLAVRNAWVSGGVEWNIGIIGHSPFTCEQLFVATFEEEGLPVLRMYEYERIRGITYQMDFFLPEDSKFLMARMRVVNPNQQMVPMYWWSNIAVKEQHKGRLIVNADNAYTNHDQGVYKETIPVTKDGIDVSDPNNIPKAVDYFFNIADETRKYITYLNQAGYGLIQTSTKRLKGRKLFTWGQTVGSSRWQNYLTQSAGKYLEIQAGLAKTQYECIPMPPNTAWEWIEAYGAIKIEENYVNEKWKVAVSSVEKALEEKLPAQKLEKILLETKQKIALKHANYERKGSIFGSIENERRKIKGENTLQAHLDFGSIPKGDEWLNLLKNGEIGEHPGDVPPTSYMLDDDYYEALKQAVMDKEQENWYAWYHLGLNQLIRNALNESCRSFEKALEKQESPFVHHALSITYSKLNSSDKAVYHAKKAIEQRKNDLALIKDCFEILLQEAQYKLVIELIETGIDVALRDNTNIRFYLAYSHAKLNNLEEASKIILGKGYLEVDDIREGSSMFSDLWETIEKEREIPFEFDFRMN
ncbi:MAG: DUF5107 domain-containing protein [Cellulosilyticaceae bacterium]